MDQRVQFIADYQRAVFDIAELARRYGISRKTAYKWIERYEIGDRPDWTKPWIIETPGSVYQPSPRALPRTLAPLEYPGHFEVRLGSRNSGIRWKKHWVCVTHTLAGDYVGLEEVDDGLWDVYFGPVKLGRMNERILRIEDHKGRIVRRGPAQTATEPAW